MIGRQGVRRADAEELLNSPAFAKLGLAKSRGNRDKQPPPEEQVWALIRHARSLSSPGFAAWLQVACFTGLRPGELDALRWDYVDLDAGRIHVVEQYSGLWELNKDRIGTGDRNLLMIGTRLRLR